MILLKPGHVVPFPPQVHSEKAQGRTFNLVGFPGADRAYLRAVTGALSTNNLANRRCECFDLYKHIVPYIEAWSWQKSLVRRRRILVESDEDDSDILIILQHPPVYTLGTNSSEKHLKFDMRDAPYDVYRTERGGEVTYHGPGQYQKMDLHWYLRSLEEVIIRVLSSTFSIKASRIKGLSGVWVGNQKVAAIGIRVSRWITYHGLALNVTTDLAPFRHIVPCGICDREVGSLRELLGRTSSEQTTKDGILMDVTRESLLREFSEVFQLSLEFRPISDLDRLNKESETLPMSNNF